MCIRDRFRDLRYFNYWGRIPRELARYGADIYYGNQEAFATVAYNAGDIYRKIQEICRETGCEKVNIIAVSYTHLDVYKRQRHDRRADWPGI